MQETIKTLHAIGRRFQGFTIDFRHEFGWRVRIVSAKREEWRITETGADLDDVIRKVVARADANDAAIRQAIA